MESSLAAIDALWPWRDYDYRSLSNLSAELNGIVANLTLVKDHHEVESVGNLRRTVAKMPPRLTEDWARHVYSLRPVKPTMITLADWLEGLLAARNVIGLRTNPLGPAAQQTVERPRRPNVFNSTTTRPPNAPEKCPCCDGRHYLLKCRQFQGLPVERRAEIAKLNARCFRCLETGHIGAGCSKRTVCGKDGCKAKHHYLLHAAPRIFPGRRNSTSS